MSLMSMPHDVEATLFYYKCKNGMPPETNDIELLLGNKDADAQQVTIGDIRGNEHIKFPSPERVSCG
jgi:hypothetical protein